MAILMAVVAVLLAQAVRAKLFDVPTGLLILVFGCGGGLVYGGLVCYALKKEDDNT